MIKIVFASKEERKKVKKVIVLLDSNHTHDCSRRIKIVWPTCHENSYLVVFDTLIENMPKIYIITDHGRKVITKQQFLNI